MCLVLGNNWEEQTEKFKQKKKIIGYKCVYKSNIANTIYRAEYRDFFWCDGLNISSRATNETSVYERLELEVHEGFHFFTTLRAAKKYSSSGNPPIIIRLSIDPKDVVAVGWFNRYKSFVATKATLLGESKCIKQS